VIERDGVVAGTVLYTAKQVQDPGKRYIDCRDYCAAGGSFMELILAQLLNGLVFGVLLFLMAAGLSLIFGLMNVVSLAHGSFSCSALLSG